MSCSSSSSAKNSVYVITQVGRAPRCVVGWERTADPLQAILDCSPQAQQHYADNFPTITPWTTIRLMPKILCWTRSGAI